MAERLYRIHVAAELAGVSEGVLRAWERRYGLVKPRRTSGGYRAYTDQDIELLRRVKRVTDEGVSIGEVSLLIPELRRELEGESRSSGELPDEAQLGRWREQALEAALRFDQAAVEAVLDTALARVPPLLAWSQVFGPLEAEVGRLWHEKTLGSAQEHMVSHAVRVRLMGLLHNAPRESRRHVVCACLPHEEHEFGLLQAALRFRHAGDRVTYLGARVEAERLADLVKRVKAEVVALSAVNDVGARRFTKTLENLVSQLPKTRVVIGGPAAQANAAVCNKLKVTLIESDADWETIL